MSYLNIIADGFTTVTINGNDSYNTPRNQRGHSLDDSEPPHLVRSSNVPETNIISNNFANDNIKPLEFTNSVVLTLNFNDEEEDSDLESLCLKFESLCLSDDDEEEQEFDKASLTSDSTQAADDRVYEP
jgi:hypothetical protein